MLGLTNSLASLDVPPGTSTAVNYSLSLDGDDQYAHFPQDTLSTWNFPAGSSHLSISLWYKMTDTGEDQAFIGKAVADGNPNTFLFGQWADKYFLGYYGTTATWNKTGTGSDPDTVAVTYGAWRHVVLTLEDNGTNTVLKIYEPEANASTHVYTETLSGRLSPIIFQGSLSYGVDSYDGDWTIGMENDGGPTATDHFNGFITEIGFFDAVLDINDAVAIYNSGDPLSLISNSGNYDKAGNLKSYFKTNEGSGTTLINSGTTSRSSNFNATLVNAPTYSTDVPTS
jgi:hypothetical protein